MNTRPLQVRQANTFFNYTAGLDATGVDLLKTARKLLTSEVVRAVCFSDMKCLYLDGEGVLQVEWLQPRGRRWDNQWKIEFSKELPRHVAADLTFCMDLLFHEGRIENAEATQLPSHLRAALPPFVLEWSGFELPIYPWVKVYADGIITVSYQVDATWEGIGESDFVREVVNLFKRYCERVWVRADLQRIDAMSYLPSAFESELSIGGQPLGGRRIRRLLGDLRKQSLKALDTSLGSDGESFEIGGESWVLHPIAGSEDQVAWEASFDLCRSIYASVATSVVVPMGAQTKSRASQPLLWQGRPSISLMRFADQPDSKEVLLERFSESMSRLLLRASDLPDPPPLPRDLRLFSDYCLHGNRALLLWTWLRQIGSPDNAWDDSSTRGRLLENQARAEHFEYHNLRLARACAIAASPSSDEQLVAAYEVLATAESSVLRSSQSGEIADAVAYLLDITGTMGLINSGKEQARWHLDERRYRREKARSRVDRWLAIVFGGVGAAGLADLVVRPFLNERFQDLGLALSGLIAFSIATGVVGLLAAIVWALSRTGRY